MPDPHKRTISATQAPALFNASPYATRWMLYQHFAKGMSLDGAADSRMRWGHKMQPLIIEQAAVDLKLEVRPNADDSYQRNGLLGCTRDAMIICPDRGPGALETKCVFDYGVWMRDWEGGGAVPKHNEIQLQVQCMVGDGREPWRWGVIAAWVCGEVKYFQREPIPELWERLNAAARSFFADVEAGREPNPFGAPVELPWMRELFPTERGKVLDLTADGGDEEVDGFADVVLRYRDAREQQSAGEATCEPLRARILAVAKDANEIRLPSGIRVRITTSGPHKGKRITVFVPETAGERTPAEAFPVEEYRNAG